MADEATAHLPLPSWLAIDSGPHPRLLPSVGPETIAELNNKEIKEAGVRALFGRALTYTEYEGSNGTKLARVEWSNEGQMIEVGLLLRGAGYDAVKVLYSGTSPLIPAGRQMERKVQAELSGRFGVVLDWGVPL